VSTTPRSAVSESRAAWIVLNSRSRSINGHVRATQ
jgi:hypothetical protein